MSLMLELTTRLSNQLSENQIVESLAEYIDQYQRDPSSENFQKIASAAMMVMTKMSINAAGGVDKVLDHIRDTDKIQKVFMHTQNHS